MVQEIINSMIELRVLIITCAVGILLMGGVLVVLCRKFSWNGKNRKVIGFLYELDQKNILLLSLCLLRVLFVIGYALSGCRNGFVPVWFFTILLVMIAVIGRDFEKLPVQIVHATIMTVTMFVMSILSGYLRDIYMDYRIVIALVLLSLFLLLYAICDVFRCVNRIMDKKL